VIDSPVIVFHRAAPAADQVTCRRSLNWDGNEPFCDEPAAVIVRSVCVHEHIEDEPACWHSLSDMRKLDPDDRGWDCDLCAEGRSPHECPVVVTVTEIGVNL